MERISDANLTGNELKRVRQKRRILSLLYKHIMLTGPEISKRIGVSLPTALSLIYELIDQNLVETRGSAESSGGRRPALYGLAGNSLVVVACEIERYKGKVVLYNSNNQKISPIHYFDTNINDDQLTKKILTHARQLIEENKIEEKRVFGIGVIMPGLIDERQGVNFSIRNKKLGNIQERLHQEFPKIIYVNNDARMQAFGEYIFGAARNHKNSIIVNWSWGIGLGIIMEGKLYNGSDGFAGELSHIQMVEDGNLCFCGKRGCLETVSSASVIVNEAMQGIKEKRVSQLTEKFKENPCSLTPEDVIIAAKSGDEFSIQLLHQVGLALGKGLALTIHLLNPEMIVLGGPVSTANQFVLNPIQQSLNKYCLEHIAANTKLVISDIWEHSGLLGVTAMLYQKIFSELMD
ncbi:MAG: ROK family transcriptional regulator [Mariniphaga sp.]|nr:ROK family transcriptional regulator [Mariniphaga sp.]MDD4426253.1 ROK family transcriptional regulator [Mariniphaga sp.]